MANLNEHTSVLGAILSDISDVNDANFILYTVGEWMSTMQEWRSNAGSCVHSSRLADPNFCWQTRVMSLKLQTAKFLTDAKKMRALSQEKII